MDHPCECNRYTGGSGTKAYIIPKMVLNFTNSDSEIEYSYVRPSNVKFNPKGCNLQSRKSFILVKYSETRLRKKMRF